jgi:hypothetical protein
MLTWIRLLMMLSFSVSSTRVKCAAVWSECMWMLQSKTSLRSECWITHNLIMQVYLCMLLNMALRLIFCYFFFSLCTVFYVVFCVRFFVTLIVCMCVSLVCAKFEGPGTDERSKIGPMVSAMQRDIVAKQVDSAVKQGARILYQGSIPSGDEWTGGNWYPPTVLVDVTNSMNINMCETFGPIVAIATFDGSERQAIKYANDTEYGLASYVYTSDMVRAQRVALGIRSGQVGINCYSLFNANMLCPWVGHKGSGFGYHSGSDGWRQFSLPKSLVFDTPLPPPIMPAASL